MSDKTLEATVLVQGCLLRALAWKQAVPDEPLARHLNNHYAKLAKELNAQNPVDSELIAELAKALQTASSGLPRNI